MKTKAEQLVYAYRAARVKRWHTMSHMAYEETVGHHSHGVAMILLVLHPTPSKHLILAALMHDLGEKAVGDMSHWAKKANPEMATMLGELEQRSLVENFQYMPLLAPEDFLWLKAADALHAWMVLRDNVLCGNLGVLSVYNRLSDQIRLKVHSDEWPVEITQAMDTMADQKIWQDT